MFRFEEATYLTWIWIIPVLIGLYIAYWYYKKRQKALLGQEMQLARLVNQDDSSRSKVKFAIAVVALLSLLLALANPQWGNKKEKVKAQSSDIFIALDISQSMMAEDISPNRLERAKRLAQTLIRALKGNRIGLIWFAGNAYLQMPLSNDYSAAQLFITSANTRQASTQGTAISEAIQLAMRTYEEGKAHQRAMIIITDGESHDDEAIEMAENARAAGMNIFTIGVGTSDGAYIPYRTAQGEQYKRDETGSLVKSVLNQSLIDGLASAGGGESYLIGEGNAIITDLEKRMDSLEKAEVEQRAFTNYNSYFQYLIALGLLFLIGYYFIPETSESNIKK